jgi:SNF2 family DNA or RNA helicase
MLHKYLKLPVNTDAIGDHHIVVFDGSVKPKNQGNLLLSINTDDKKYILLTTFRFRAVGHNLQKFTTVIFLDQNWNPQILPFIHTTTQI